MALDEQLLDRGSSSDQSETTDGSSSLGQENDTPSLRSATLRAAKRSGSPSGSRDPQTANNLNEAKQMAKVGVQLVAGNKVAAVKTILTNKQMQKRIIMGAASSCACCLLPALFWVVIIALLLKVVSNPLYAAGIVIGWVWDGLKAVVQAVTGG